MRRILIQLLLLVSVVGCHMELPPQPVAKFTITNGGCIAPCPVTFTSNSENATSYEWDFNDGSPVATGVSVTHEYSKGKIYTVKLIAKSKDGGSSGAQQMVEVKPEPASLPEADFKYTMENAGVAPSPVTFDNQSGNAVTYKWDFGDPNATSANPNTSSDQDPKHTYSAPGKYTVTLTAYNADGESDTQQYTIEVKAEGPTASFLMDKEECEAPCEVSFTNASTKADTYSWDFGDKSGANTETSPKHTYTVPGTYTVILTATGAGGSDTETKTVIVEVKAKNAITIKSKYSTGESIVTDGAGNIYVCGTTQGTTDFGNGKILAADVNSVDFFVAKYDKNWLCQWAVVNGSDGWDYAHSIVLDDANNVYVTGTLAGNIRSGLADSFGETDGFVSRINGSSGAIEWFKTFGGPSGDSGWGIGFYRTKDGPKIYMAGSVSGSAERSNIHFDQQLRSANSEDICFVFFDAADGKIGPPTIVGGEGNQSINSMVVDDQGNAYFTGTFTSSLTLSRSVEAFKIVGLSDAFVAKWNLVSAEWQWSEQIGSIGHDAGQYIAVDKGGNVYAAGVHTDYIRTSGTTASEDDQNVFVWKWNTRGDLQWTMSGFGSSNDYAGGIAIRPGGELVISGAFSGSGKFPARDAGLTAFQSQGRQDVIYSEVNPGDGSSTGKLHVAGGGAEGDSANGICAGQDGSVYATGRFIGVSAVFNDETLTADENNSHIYIVKYKY